ncbi:MAG: DUF2520 domain-containing protein [Sandaracinus sp.]
MTSRAASGLVVIGRGRVGRTLAARAKEAGLSVRLVAGRTLGTSAQSRAAVCTAALVWIAVPDPALPEIDRVLASWLSERAPRARPVVAHASGARGPDALAACAALGVAVASAHPVISFGTTATRLEDASFVLAGDGSAVRRTAALVRRLGARPIVRALHGPRYHAALALAANGTAALGALATEWLTHHGALTSLEASRMLASLLRSVADNVGRVGAAQALTGPIARGDATAVQRHLAALSPDEQRDYAAVSRLVLRAATARGLGATEARAIERVLARATRASARSQRATR